jgi:hypothetical protein
LFLDRENNVLAVAAPPIDDPELNAEFSHELEKLMDCGKVDEQSKRGCFSIVECGLQMGPGSPVYESLF